MTRLKFNHSAGRLPIPRCRPRFAGRPPDLPHSAAVRNSVDDAHAGRASGARRTADGRPTDS